MYTGFVDRWGNRVIRQTLFFTVSSCMRLHTHTCTPPPCTHTYTHTHIHTHTHTHTHTQKHPSVIPLAHIFNFIRHQDRQRSEFSIISEQEKKPITGSGAWKNLLFSPSHESHRFLLVTHTHSDRQLPQSSVESIFPIRLRQKNVSQHNHCLCTLSHTVIHTLYNTHTHTHTQMAQA